MSETLSDDDRDFIVWARRNAVPVDKILSVLDDKGKKVSRQKLYTTYSRLKDNENIGKFDPYETRLDETYNPENKEPDELSSEPFGSVVTIPNTNVTDLSPILKAAGIVKKEKIQQIKDIFSMTDGQPVDLAKALEISACSPLQQRQILSHIYGPDILEEILTGKQKSRFVQDQKPNIISEKQKLMQQVIDSKRERLAFEEVDEALERIENKGSLNAKDIKELMYLKTLSNSENNKNNPYEKLLTEKLLKEDSSVVNAIKAFSEFQKVSANNKGEDFTKELLLNILTKKDDNNLGSTIEAMAKMIEITKPSENNNATESLQKELMEIRKINSDQQMTFMKDMIENQRMQLENENKKNEQFLQQMRKMDDEKLQLVIQQMKEKVDGSVRTKEDWEAQMSNTINLAEKMGYIKKSEANTAGRDEVLARLQTTERILTNTVNALAAVPEKISAGIFDGLERGGSIFESYLGYMERREQRQLKMQNQIQNYYNNKQQEPTRRKTYQERENALEDLETKLDDLENAKKYKNRFEQLEAEE